jgi:predicted Rossmann fold flavoprotein
MEKYSTAVVGGGAAGIWAAISRARLGNSVVICEKMPQLGKKILASGNGKCNLLNDDFNESYYNAAARPMVRCILSRFGKSEIINVFKELGLDIYSNEGRIYPITNQAATVLKLLEIELKRLRILIEYSFECDEIRVSPSGIQLSSKSGKKIVCQNAIIAVGGKTFPSYGSDGSFFKTIEKLGHSIIAPVPVAVPLVVKDPICQVLQGQKIFASARSLIDGREGVQVRGDLLFTKYGLSGTCILDISEDISLAINRNLKKDVWAVIDLVPFMDHEGLKSEISRRLSGNWKMEDLTVGILPNKFGPVIKPFLSKRDLDSLVSRLKAWRFRIESTLGWNEAEFTAGGVAVSEVQPATLESKIKRGVYFAGEILDVNGKRGGYNLGWAWASGWVAGECN